MSWVLDSASIEGHLSDGCALTIGVYDGVHRGHHALLRHTVAWARAHGLPAVVLTFVPHPMAVLRPDQAPRMLCSLSHRVNRLLQLGIDVVVLQPFDDEFAQLSAEQFILRVLQDRLNAKAVVVGDDFRFGHQRTGTIETLRQASAFEVISVPAVLDETGERISSTRVRQWVAEGQVESARQLLGEPFTWEGVVVQGERRGRELGYPTANLCALEPLLLPAPGVYACRAQLDDRIYPAAVSVGTPPMFPNAPGMVEAFLIGYEGEEFYGCPMTLQFLARLRPQQKFDSIDALKAQMAQDVERTLAVAEQTVAV
ncbi:MAG: bifunctional riboflavin kinase/FAD synthetase [Fimbriimonadales bacterium]